MVLPSPVTRLKCASLRVSLEGVNPAVNLVLTPARATRATLNQSAADSLNKVAHDSPQLNGGLVSARIYLSRDVER